MDQFQGQPGQALEKFPYVGAVINEALQLFLPIAMTNRTELKDVQVLLRLNCHLQVNWQVSGAYTSGLSEV